MQNISCKNLISYLDQRRAVVSQIVQTIQGKSYQVQSQEIKVQSYDTVTGKIIMWLRQKKREKRGLESLKFHLS
jgi:hypothetical protein